MTSGLPSLKASEVLRALERGGFRLARSSGSHHRMIHVSDPRRATTVPVHGGKDLPRSLLRAVIKQAGFTVEEFLALL